METIQLVLDLSAITAAVLIATTEILLWRELRKFNQNFHLIQTSVTRIYDELKPLITALQKATPFLEVFNSIAGMFRHKRVKK